MPDLADFVSPGEAIGKYIEQNQIERAAHLCEERDLDNIQFRIGDVIDVQFLKDSFNVVFSLGVIEYLEDQRMFSMG